MLGCVGEACRLVDRIPDNGVLVTLLGADVAGDREARRDPDGGVDSRLPGVEGQQLPADRSRPAQGSGGVVVLGHGRTEYAKRTVALELVDPPALRSHRSYDDVKEAIEDVHDFVRPAGSR